MRIRARFTIVIIVLSVLFQDYQTHQKQSALLLAGNIQELLGNVKRERY
jgi:hypothetical protein